MKASNDSKRQDVKHKNTFEITSASKKINKIFPIEVIRC